MKTRRVHLVDVYLDSDPFPKLGCPRRAFLGVELCRVLCTPDTILLSWNFVGLSSYSATNR